MRRPLLLCACVVLAAGPTVLAFASGGYFERPRLIALAVAAVVLTVVALTVRRPLPCSTAGRAALAALALYAAWVALASTWAPVAFDARADVQRALLYLATFAAAAAAWRARERLTWLEPALAAGALIVIGEGLSGRLVPSLIALDRTASAGGRLEQPLTYWNATGSLAAIGFVLCARLAGEPERRRGVRCAAAAAAVPLAIGVYLSFSRGALAALAVGLLVVLLVAPTRPQLRAVAVAVIAGALACAVAGGADGVRSLQGAGNDRAVQGAGVLGAALALGAFSALLTAAATRRGGEDVRPLSLAPWVRPAAIAALIAALAVPVLISGRDHPAAFGATTQRFASASSNRYDYWRVALDVGADHPLGGVGPSGFAVQWLQRRTIDEPVRDAHSFELEAFAELGLVGFLLALSIIAAAGWAGIRATRRNASLTGGLLAATAVWAVGSAIDWSWEMPALTLVAVVAAGALAGAVDDRRQPDGGQDDEPGLRRDAEAREAVGGD